MPRVVLVGHDASATGAPLAALAFTRWATGSRRAEIEVLLDRGGPLVAAFEAAAPTRVRARAAGEVVAAADALGGLAAGRWARRGILLTHRPAASDVTVVAASIAAWRSAAAVATGDRRLVLWLHELDGVADRLVTASERAALLSQTDHIVAVGGRVGAMVLERWGVAEDRVSVVESFVDPLDDTSLPEATSTTRAHDLVAVGSLIPRKGAEHLVALTSLLRQERPDLRSAWVGGPLDSPYADLVRTDRAAAGLDGAVDLVGPVDDVGPWWPTTGVVVHLAREDPAPLVAIEAAQRAIPVVTWDTGGAADLVRAAGLAHLVAPAGDLVGVAAAVSALLDDRAARADAGAALQSTAASRTTDRLAPALLEALTGIPA